MTRKVKITLMGLSIALLIVSFNFCNLRSENNKTAQQLEAKTNQLEGIYEQDPPIQALPDMYDMEKRLEEAQTTIERLEEEARIAAQTIKKHEDEEKELAALVESIEAKFKALAETHEAIKEQQAHLTGTAREEPVTLQHVRLCNERRGAVNVSLAYFSYTEGGFVARGWDSINAGACKDFDLLDNFTDIAFFYALAARNRPNEDLSVMGMRFCVRESPFSFPDSIVKDPFKIEHCPRRGDYYYVRAGSIMARNGKNSAERIFYGFEGRR